LIIRYCLIGILSSVLGFWISVFSSFGILLGLPGYRGLTAAISSINMLFSLVSWLGPQFS